jgi:hypothetical protein
MKGARTLVFDTSNRAGDVAYPFPLTPALSLGERENRSPLLSIFGHQRFSKCGGGRRVFALLHNGLRLFPLPVGEGQGEGERGFRRLSRAMFSAVASV